MAAPQGGAEIAGGGAHIQNREAIARADESPDDFTQDAVTSEISIDALKIREHVARLLRGCLIKQFRDNATFVFQRHCPRHSPMIRCDFSVCLAFGPRRVRLARPPRIRGLRVNMDFVTGKVGWIEAICGPMFSGKSEELIRRLRRATIARKRVQVFKPVIDDRYSLDEIVSHGDVRMKSEVIGEVPEILARLDWRTEVVGIDEANFFGQDLVAVATQLADSGKQVIVAGLDTDYMGRPFPPMPDLLTLAESITKTLAICMRCGNPAKHTQRLIDSSDLIVVGATGIYEARCRRCFEPGAPRQEYLEFARPDVEKKN